MEAGGIEAIWKSGELDGGEMWLLSIEQIDIRTWSVYATRLGEFAGRVESPSIRAAVEELAGQISRGETVKYKNGKRVS